MRDLGVGLAILDDRPEHQRRGVHQQARGFAGKCHGLVGARRGIAGQLPARGLAPAGATEKVASGKRAAHAVEQAAFALDADTPSVAFGLEAKRQRRRRHPAFGLFRPLHQDRPVRSRVGEAEFLQFAAAS